MYNTHCSYATQYPNQFYARQTEDNLFSKSVQYKVVINHEEQYSIVPSDQSLSRGWREVGKIGTQKECLTYIEEVWTDMLPSDKDRILRRLSR